MRKLKNKIFTLIQIIIILALVLVICLLVYFFLFKGYSMPQIEEMSGVSLDSTNENTIETSQVPLKEESQEYQIAGIDDTYSYQNSISTQEQVNVDKNYYYSQLDNLAKEIYNSLDQNRENLKNGTYEIILPNSVTNILYETNGDTKLATAFQDAWDAFIYDYTDMFFIDTSKVCLLTETTTLGLKKTYKVSIGKGNNTNYFEDSFSSPEQVQNALYMLEDVKNQMKNQLTGLSDYNKIKKVHDWLVENVEYDTSMSRKNNHNIYGAFIERNVVCEGYAKAFKYIMDGLDIPCILVKGVATNSVGETEDHMWNYVYLDNSWYAIDVTWDDPIIQGGGWLTDNLKYAHFLKGSNTFNKSHVNEGQISMEGRIFSYPVLSVSNYK